MAGNQSRGINVEELENALKVLKAIQREAKKATQTLRELENAKKAVTRDE